MMQGMNPLEMLFERAKRLPRAVIAGELEGQLNLLPIARSSVLGEFVARRLGEIEGQLADSGFVEPAPSAGLDNGEYEILRTLQGQAVRVTLGGGGENPVTHLAVYGQSNTGKSCLQAVIARECAGKAYSLIIDVNRFYSRIASLHNLYHFILWNDLRLNPFDCPSGVDASQLDQVMISELCENYSLQFAEFEIAEVVSELRRKGTPNWVSIERALTERSYPKLSNRSRYRDSAVLIIRNMLGATRDVFRCAVGMNLLDLLSNNIVLQLDGLLVEHQSYIIRFLVSYLYLAGVSC